VLAIRASRVALVDRSQREPRVRLTKAHEIGHEIIPWHEAAFRLDDEERLLGMTRDQLEDEAYLTGGHPIFQGQRFHERDTLGERELQPELQPVGSPFDGPPASRLHRAAGRLLATLVPLGRTARRYWARPHRAEHLEMSNRKPLADAACEIRPLRLPGARPACCLQAQCFLRRPSAWLLRCSSERRPRRWAAFAMMAVFTALRIVERRRMVFVPSSSK
jgi:hypothetical protein